MTVGLIGMVHLGPLPGAPQFQGDFDAVLAAATSDANVLAEAGFDVREVPEGHLCCGSAGTYNLLQPDLSARLRARKVAHL